MTDSGALFIPDAGTPPNEAAVDRFFGNIGHEIQRAPDGEDARRLGAYYREAGLLHRPDKKRFFQHHFVTNVAAALPILFGNSSHPRIVDLGCGMGTQSILLALCGAEVIGVDLDEQALAVAERRARLYADASGRRVDARFVCANALELDFAALAPVDAVYSLFAFNMIQPSAALLDRMVPALAPRAVVVIQDGNRRMWFNRLFRPRPVLSASELQHVFRERGLDARSTGLYAVPPLAWLLPALASPLDRVLRRSELFSGSLLHIARMRR